MLLNDLKAFHEVMTTDRVRFLQLRNASRLDVAKRQPGAKIYRETLDSDCGVCGRAAGTCDCYMDVVQITNGCAAPLDLFGTSTGFGGLF